MIALVLTVLAQAPDLDRARSQFDEMKYEAALKSLAKAIMTPGLTPTDRAQIYLYTGLCRSQTGDEKGAQAAFREALAIDRAIELPDGVGPKTRLTFERARAELPQVQAAPAPPVPVPSPPPPPAVELPTPEPAPAAVVEAPPPPPPSTKRWWPMVLSGGVAAASFGTGLYFGSHAQQLFTMADAEPFASDGMPIAQSAHSQALAANVLYVVAGVALLFAIIAAFAF